MTFRFLKLKLAAGLILVLTCCAAYAADTVGLVDSRKIIFQHPKFDEASKILLFFRTSVEGNLALVLEREKDPERRRILMNYSAQVSEFAELDRAISAEADLGKKEKLWEDRQRKLSAFEAGLMGAIYEDCMEAIKTVMTLKKMTVLIELDSAYYGGTEVTEDVIQQLKKIRR